MAAMSAGVTGSYLGYLAQSAFLSEEKRGRKLKATHTKAARRVSEDLMALRGPAMKLGQTLSLHTDLLHAETLAELSKLQMQAPGMHPSLVRAQFRSSVGRDPEESYKTFTPEPFAAASLGQVHYATLKNGEQVAVKIQYPGIRDAIENDFKWFRAVSKPAQLSQYLPESAVDELRAQIIAECDYEREAENVAFFRRHLARLPYVDVPYVHAKLSTDKVLTMSVVRGEYLDSFLAKRPSQRLRNLVGERLFELFYFQLMEMQALHADPHWGKARSYPEETSLPGAPSAPGSPSISGPPSRSPDATRPRSAPHPGQTASRSFPKDCPGSDCRTASRSSRRPSPS
ncbi:MAG: AarF/ABC1/UbiB kinase family protein [Gemmatimonadaceae bacterium]